MVLLKASFKKSLSKLKEMDFEGFIDSINKDEKGCTY